VWISEQTEIISVHNINLLIFITEAECLLRGTESILNAFQVNLFVEGRTMGQAARPLCHRRGPGSIPGQCRFVVGKAALGQ